jgi:hypothetical protein
MWDLWHTLKTSNHSNRNYLIPNTYCASLCFYKGIRYRTWYSRLTTEDAWQSTRHLCCNKSVSLNGTLGTPLNVVLKRSKNLGAQRNLSVHPWMGTSLPSPPPHTEKGKPLNNPQKEPVYSPHIRERCVNRKQALRQTSRYNEVSVSACGTLPTGPLTFSGHRNTSKSACLFTVRCVRVRDPYVTL